MVSQLVGPVVSRNPCDSSPVTPRDAKPSATTSPCLRVAVVVVVVVVVVVAVAVVVVVVVAAVSPLLLLPLLVRASASANRTSASTCARRVAVSAPRLGRDLDQCHIRLTLFPKMQPLFAGENVGLPAMPGRHRSCLRACGQAQATDSLSTLS